MLLLVDLSQAALHTTRCARRKSDPSRSCCLGVEVINLSHEMCYARYFVENSPPKTSTDCYILEFSVLEKS